MRTLPIIALVCMALLVFGCSKPAEDMGLAAEPDISPEQADINEMDARMAEEALEAGELDMPSEPADVTGTTAEVSL